MKKANPDYVHMLEGLATRLAPALACEGRYRHRSWYPKGSEPPPLRQQNSGPGAALSYTVLRYAVLKARHSAARVGL